GLRRSEQARQDPLDEEEGGLRVRVRPILYGHRSSLEHLDVSASIQVWKHRSRTGELTDGHLAACLDDLRWNLSRREQEPLRVIGSGPGPAQCLASSLGPVAWPEGAIGRIERRGGPDQGGLGVSIG